MKRCTKCGLEKPESEFGKCSRAKDGLSWWCKECRRTYSRKWFNDNKERLVEYKREHNQKWYRKYKDHIVEQATTYSKLRRRIFHEVLDSYKQPCVKCGETRLYLIEFHHINPSEKSFNISNKMTTDPIKLQSEVDKCVTLCRNCHKEFHYFYGIQPKKPVESLSEYLGKEVT